MKQTRFAIFDPIQNKFLGSASDLYRYPEPTALVWTDKVHQIWSSLSYDEFPGRLGLIFDQYPSAYIAEIELQVSWRPAIRSEVSLELRYAKAIATYKSLLPQFEADADAMPKKDWDKFRAAHARLKGVGFPVCSGLGPTPQKIDYR